MKRVLISQLPTLKQSQELPEDEAHHLIHVLRISNGDTLECLNGKGQFSEAKAEFLGKGKVRVVALSDPKSNPKLLSQPITLEMSILKGDAMEWTIEKAVEIGVRQFVPLQTAHCVVQVDKKGPEAFQERWQKIADQALKQCGRLDRMVIEKPVSLELGMQRKTPIRLWLDENTRNDSPSLIEALGTVDGATLIQGVSFLMGPEGGWSERERDFLARQNSIRVSAGPWVYRAETAALFAASVIANSMR